MKQLVGIVLAVIVLMGVVLGVVYQVRGGQNPRQLFLGDWKVISSTHPGIANMVVSESEITYYSQGGEYIRRSPYVLYETEFTTDDRLGRFTNKYKLLDRDHLVVYDETASGKEFGQKEVTHKTTYKRVNPKE